MKTEIEYVKRAKAEAMFRNDVRVYGTREHALRALNCTSEDEAIGGVLIWIWEFLGHKKGFDTRNGGGR